MRLEHEPFFDYSSGVRSSWRRGWLTTLLVEELVTCCFRSQLLAAEVAHENTKERLFRINKEKLEPLQVCRIHLIIEMTCVDRHRAMRI